MKKIAILGFGLEGQALLNFFLKDSFYKKSEITVCDRNPRVLALSKKSARQKKSGSGVFFQLGENYLKNLEKFDIIFRSPGVPYDLPEIQEALKSGVEVSSATKLFFDRARKMKCRIIGITGTKGKGTTTTLIYRILKASGKDVFLAGNIGKPTLELLPLLSVLDSPQSAIVVLELSSFQLLDLNVSPEIAVVLDIFPDHLDVHKNLQEYIGAKASIAKYQKKRDKIFFFGDNRYSKIIAQKNKGLKILVLAKKFDLFEPKDLKIPGDHNFRNAVMAATVCLSLGCHKKTILKTIRSFKGNEHRLEFVRNIRGAKFYNDSASTIPQTMAAAVAAFEETKILIVGGRDKNLDYTPLVKELKDSNTELIVLFGENKHKIKRALATLASSKGGRANSKIKVIAAKNLKTAVNLAYQSARQLQSEKRHRSVFIIFSPASTSFDMFLNYAERGKAFKKIVKEL